MLGASQRAGRVVDLEARARAGTPVLRRTSSGTAATVKERALVFALALPSVSALAADASPRTLLNRNLRGFLRGFSRSGGPAAYFGREHIVKAKVPIALVGYEVTPAGAVLVEVIANLEGSLATDDPLDLATTVLASIASWAKVETRAAPAPDLARPASPITRPDDPMPLGFVAGPTRAVPIGLLDTGVGPGSGAVWLGGDALVPGFVLRAFAAGDSLEPGSFPLDGATTADLEGALASVREGWRAPGSAP